MIKVQLSTGHSKLKYHMLTKLYIAESSECHRGASPVAVERFVQSCQIHQNLRVAWPADIPVREKICGPLENL